MNLSELIDIKTILVGLWPTILNYTIILVKALVVVAAGLWLSSWMVKGVRRAVLAIPQVDRTLANFLPNVVKYILWVVIVIAVLGAFGVETSSILTLLGAAGLAIGLALQGTLQNIAAGLMLLLLRPFRVDDYIEAGSVAGTVQVIGLFSCEVLSANGQYISVPNSNLWNVPITNFSRNPKARLEINFGIAYSNDMTAAMAALRQLLAEDELVEQDPKPEVYIAQFADSAVIVRTRFWVSKNNQWTAPFHFNLRGRQVLEAAGCSIPFPQREVHVYQTDGAKAAALRLSQE